VALVPRWARTEAPAAIEAFGSSKVLIFVWIIAGTRPGHVLLSVSHVFLLALIHVFVVVSNLVLRANRFSIVMQSWPS
jgi:hypothetical protein